MSPADIVSVAQIAGGPRLTSRSCATGSGLADVRTRLLRVCCLRWRGVRSSHDRIAFTKAMNGPRSFGGCRSRPAVFVPSPRAAGHTPSHRRGRECLDWARQRPARLLRPVSRGCYFAALLNARARSPEATKSSLWHVHAAVCSWSIADESAYRLRCPIAQSHGG
jgi:hypothetical protein